MEHTLQSEGGLSLVIPCYNEEEALPKTAEALKQKICVLQKDERFHSIQNYKVILLMTVRPTAHGISFKILQKTTKHFAE